MWKRRKSLSMFSMLGTLRLVNIIMIQKTTAFVLVRYINPASTTSERNIEPGFVNKLLGASSSASYK
jgi:hypothetical protein